MSKEWGIYPENIIPRQWWGARALIEYGKMILLPDRQNYERDSSVSETDKLDFFFWMENTMDKEIRKKVKEGFFQAMGGCLHVGFRKRTFSL